MFIKAASTIPLRLVGPKAALRLEFARGPHSHQGVHLNPFTNQTHGRCSSRVRNFTRTFRLYFVDTTESRLRRIASDEQVAYFGLTRATIRPRMIFLRSSAFSKRSHRKLFDPSRQNRAHSLPVERQMQSVILR